MVRATLLLFLVISPAIALQGQPVDIFDVDDGVCTPGDFSTCMWWATNGGGLGPMLMGADLSQGHISLVDFFASPAAMIQPAAQSGVSALSSTTWYPALAICYFVRGDANGDGAVQISDGVLILNYAFGTGGPPKNFDAADANDDGSIDVADGTTVLNYLFAGGNPPASPFPDEGLDLTPDNLMPECEEDQLSNAAAACVQGMLDESNSWERSSPAPAPAPLGRSVYGAGIARGLVLWDIDGDCIEELIYRSGGSNQFAFVPGKFSGEWKYDINDSEILGVNILFLGRVDLGGTEYLVIARQGGRVEFLEPGAGLSSPSATIHVAGGINVALVDSGRLFLVKKGGIEVSEVFHDGATNSISNTAFVDVGAQIIGVVASPTQVGGMFVITAGPGAVTVDQSGVVQDQSLNSPALLQPDSVSSVLGWEVAGQAGLLVERIDFSATDTYAIDLFVWTGVGYTLLDSKPFSSGHLFSVAIESGASGWSLAESYENPATGVLEFLVTPIDGTGFLESQQFIAPPEDLLNLALSFHQPHQVSTSPSSKDCDQFMVDNSVDLSQAYCDKLEKMIVRLQYIGGLNASGFTQPVLADPCLKSIKTIADKLKAKKDSGKIKGIDKANNEWPPGFPPARGFVQGADLLVVNINLYPLAALCDSNSPLYWEMIQMLFHEGHHLLNPTAPINDGHPEARAEGTRLAAWLHDNWGMIPDDGVTDPGWPGGAGHPGSPQNHLKAAKTYELDLITEEVGAWAFIAKKLCDGSQLDSRSAVLVLAQNVVRMLNGPQNPSNPNPPPAGGPPFVSGNPPFPYPTDSNQVSCTDDPTIPNCRTCSIMLGTLKLTLKCCETPEGITIYSIDLEWCGAMGSESGFFVTP